MISIAEIKAAEAETDRVRKALAQIGREIYAIREGEELFSGFRFSSYMFTDFDGTHYCGMDEQDWELGTPLVGLTFYNSQWQQCSTLTFPQAWLEGDWKQLETERLAVEKAAADEIERERRAAAKIAHEESERRTYERLKEKFA